MNETIDPLQLREWVYERLRQGKMGSQELQLNDVALHVRSRAVAAGLLPQQPFVANYDIPTAISEPVRGIIWELIIQGIVVPGIGLGGGSGQAELPFFQITDWGKRCLTAGEFVPYDTGKFIERLKARVPALDQTVVLYLTEALRCFRSAAYLASAVMLGVASERVLLELRAAIESALDSQPKKDRFIADSTGKSAKRVFDEIQKRLDPIMEQISFGLGKEDISAELSGVFGLIRKTRNDAGHPTGRNVEREEAFALLQLFPPYCGVTYEVIAWLKTQRI